MKSGCSGFELGQARNVRNIAAGINYATTATYHPTGAIATFNYGNGITHAMTPNVRGLPQQWNDGTVVQDAYVWDKNGNLTGLTDARAFVLQTRTRSMAYDARDRIASMTTAYNARTFSYTYDVLDNLRTTSANAGGRNLRHWYADDGRLTRLFDPANASLDVIAYTYDDRGNATSRTSATGFIPSTASIVPDEANRVRSMTTGGSMETFTYDGHGRRTRATTTSGTTVHFYTQAGQFLFWENKATLTTLIQPETTSVRSTCGLHRKISTACQLCTPMAWALMKTRQDVLWSEDRAQHPREVSTQRRPGLASAMISSRASLRCEDGSDRKASIAARSWRSAEAIQAGSAGSPSRLRRKARSPKRRACGSTRSRSARTCSLSWVGIDLPLIQRDTAWKLTERPQ